MIQIRQVATLASKEFRDRLRNRWVLAVALVFAVFSLVTATDCSPWIPVVRVIKILLFFLCKMSKRHEFTNQQ